MRWAAPGKDAGSARTRSRRSVRVRPRTQPGVAERGSGGTRLRFETSSTSADERGAAAARQHLLAVGAGSDERHLDVQHVLDEVDVAPSSFGQIPELRAVLQGLSPPWQDLVDRLAVVEVRLVGRKVVGLGPVAEPVAEADGNLVEGREDVELRQGQRGEAVDARGIAQRNEVEPAAAPLASGDGAELAAELADAHLVGTFDLGRKRSLANAGHVRLGDADHRADAGR